MTTPHTPGPWQFVESDDARVPDRIVSPAGATVARGSIGVNRADAALIAAAPELLAALETLRDMGLGAHAYRVACAAIARATGQA